MEMILRVRCHPGYTVRRPWWQRRNLRVVRRTAGNRVAGPVGRLSPAGAGAAVAERVWFR